MRKWVTKEEFICKCGCGDNRVTDDVVSRFNFARMLAGVPFVINSGYRCSSHNAAVGGRLGSAHTIGKAADIKVNDAKHRYAIVKALIESGFNRIGVYRTFVHADLSKEHPGEVIWCGDL